MDYKYTIKILLVIIIIFSLIIFFQSNGIILKNKNTKNIINDMILVEGLENQVDTSILLNKNDSFCESKRGSSGSLDNSCKKLTRNNCDATSCCVWTSNTQCVAGSKNGPTFNTDSNGKTKILDYYYFQGNCYGEKC
jgi:hypothetical protein